jgi:hypothetical protein
MNAYEQPEAVTEREPAIDDVVVGEPWPGGYEKETAKAIGRMKELCGIPPVLGLPVASAPQWDEHRLTS